MSDLTIKKEKLEKAVSNGQVLTAIFDIGKVGENIILEVLLEFFSPDGDSLGTFSGHLAELRQESNHK